MRKNPRDDSRHNLVVIADPQISDADEFPLLRHNAAALKNSYDKISTQAYTFGLCLGDIVGWNHSLYQEYNSIMDSTGIEWRNVMGNHDMTNYGRYFEGSTRDYEKMYGPSYYSFNVGKVHYIVLNDNFYVGKDKKVVVSLHIPTTLREWDRTGYNFNFSHIADVMCNRKAVYDILAPYDALILSGHTHTGNNEIIAENLMEHNVTSLGGAWWCGPVCVDRGPAGYKIYNFDGADVKWRFTGCDTGENCQMKVYWDAESFPGEVVANVWDYDPQWKVEYFEDGVKVCDMKRFEGKDPYASEVYRDPSSLKRGWVCAVLTQNLFRAPMSGDAKSREVRVTDHFGNVFSEAFEGAEKTADGWMVHFEKYGSEGGDKLTVRTKVLIDASELGDVAAACGVKYRVGMDSRGETGEDIAPEKAKDITRCFLYYIQTELGFKNLGIADDEFPTSDGFPFILYHREARRIEGEVTFTVNHAAKPFDSDEPLYRTGIAVGDYPIDHHHYRNPDWDNLPELHFYPIPSFNVPMGSLIPKAVDDLIVAEKSISVTNIMNGSTRLQPVVMQIGQAAGVLAALAVEKGEKVRDVPVREVQDVLLASGAYIMPYLDLKPGDENFEAIQRIGATGLIRGVGRNVDWSNQTWFAPDNPSIILEAAQIDRTEDPFHKVKIDLHGRELEESVLAQGFFHHRQHHPGITLHSEVGEMYSVDCRLPVVSDEFVGRYIIDELLSLAAKPFKKLFLSSVLSGDFFPDAIVHN